MLQVRHDIFIYLSTNKIGYEIRRKVVQPLFGTTAVKRSSRGVYLAFAVPKVQ